MKNKFKWYLGFALITGIALTGIFWSGDVVFDASRFLPETSINASDTAWLLTSSCLVLLMTPGLSFFYGGMVGSKNVISTMLQSFICLGVIALLWIAFGFSLAFGESAIGITIGETKYGLIGSFSQYAFFDQVSIYPHKDIASTIPFVLFAMFQMKFAIITLALITGSFAERVRFISYLLFIILFFVFIYTPLCHAVWAPDGILGSYFRVMDFAGGTVVHMSAGIAALAGAIFIGRRRNPEHIPTNIPFVLLGTGMLWFGWFGFNAGSALAADGTAATAFATTTAASATAMVTWIFFDRMMGRRASAMGACIGTVVGLVAITPAAGFVTVPQSIFFGFVAAIISNVFTNWKKLKNMDDSLDVFACHGIGGIVGMILTAIFASGENVSLINGGFSIFASHMVALIIVFAFCFSGALLVFYITDKILPMRVSEENETIGLDLSQHGERLN